MAQQNLNKSETTDDWEEMVYGKCYKDDPTDEERASDLLETDRWDDYEQKWGMKPNGQVNVYKQTDYGTTEDWEEMVYGKWYDKPVPVISKRKQAGRAALQGFGVAFEKSFLRNGIGKASVAHGAESKTPDISKYVEEIPGLKLKVCAVDANASTGSRTAAASVCPTGANAMACASGAEANASAALIEGLIEATARAVAGEAKASAGVGLAQLGAFAEASVSGAKAEVDVSNVPYAQAQASVLAAGAQTGASWKYTGASAGASLAEASAGPFAVRAGFKFGAGVRNGVPEVDLGLVTVPCSIM